MIFSEKNRKDAGIFVKRIGQQSWFFFKNSKLKVEHYIVVFPLNLLVDFFNIIFLKDQRKFTKRKKYNPKESNRK